MTSVSFASAQESVSDSQIQPTNTVNADEALLHIINENEELFRRADSIRVADSLRLTQSSALSDWRMPAIVSAGAPVDPLPAFDDVESCLQEFLRPTDTTLLRTARGATLQAYADEALGSESATALQRNMELDRDRQRSKDLFFASSPFSVRYQRGSMQKAPEKEKMKNDDLLRGTQIDIAGFNINYMPLKGGKPSADKWHYHAYSTFQMTQTSMSENWYKGGENNMTIYSDQKLELKRYDAEKITTFESTLQLKLGLYYTKADTIHAMRVNDNQLSWDVKYGYKAWKWWYYSTSMSFKTPVFKYYPSNSYNLKSAFLSPIDLNVNIGMDYTFANKRKTISYSLMLAPLSYYMKYVHNQEVPVKQFGIEENRRVLNQIGSSLTSKLTLKIGSAFEWSSRIYAFTSYESFLGEFENTFTFRVNRYLSANVMLYPRIDDSTDYDPWQMKEMLTFGFNYVWK